MFSKPKQKKCCSKEKQEKKAGWIYIQDMSSVVSDSAECKAHNLGLMGEWTEQLLPYICWKYSLIL